MILSISVLVLAQVIVAFIYGPQLFVFAVDFTDSLGREIVDFVEECIDDWRDVFKDMKERIKENHRGKRGEKNENS